MGQSFCTKMVSFTKYEKRENLNLYFFTKTQVNRNSAEIGNTVVWSNHWTPMFSETWIIFYFLDFSLKFLLSNKHFDFPPKFRFFPRISFFSKNFDFSSKFTCFPKISIFPQNFIFFYNFHFSPTFWFANIFFCYFTSVSQFLTKISRYLPSGA